MTSGAGARVAAAAGAGVFVLALLALLLAAGPAAALAGALLAGALIGAGVRLAAALTAAGASSAGAEPPATGSRVDRLAGESPATPAGAPTPAGAGPSGGSPDPGAGPGPEDTARLSPADVLRATDLHQTIRLDAETLTYALPDVSPEDILREREGIDEAFLKAGAGIEESATPSENVGGGSGAPAP